MKLILEIKSSKSLLIGATPELQQSIIGSFTYSNKNIQYQYKKLLGQKFWFKKKLQAKGLSETDADLVFETECTTLKSSIKVSLARIVLGQLEFPTGLKNQVLELIKPNVVQIYDLRNKPKETNGFPATGNRPKVRPYQQDQLDTLLKEGQGTVNSATGTGKTVVIQELIRKLGQPALVIVPSISILEQTINRFSDYFGRGRVGKYGDGSKKIKDITIACAPSIITSKPEDWKERQVLIFDECHHSPSDTIEQICYKFVPDAYYRYGFTATPYRADGADLAIEAACFPVVAEYPIQKGISEGYLAKPEFVMFKVNKSSSGYTSSNLQKVFQEHVIRNKYLNDAVVAKISILLKAGRRVVVLVKEKEHGYILQKALPGSVFVRTKDKDKEVPYVDASEAVGDFNAGKLQCLIGTSIIGEGTDIIPVDFLFLLSGGASKAQVIQNIGRGLRKREDKQVVVIADILLSVMNQKNVCLTEQHQRHGLKRYQWYKEIGPVKVVDL